MSTTVQAGSEQKKKKRQKEGKLRKEGRKWLSLRLLPLIAPILFAGSVNMQENKRHYGGPNVSVLANATIEDLPVTFSPVNRYQRPGRSLMVSMERPRTLWKPASLPGTHRDHGKPCRRTIKKDGCLITLADQVSLFGDDKR